MKLFGIAFLALVALAGPLPEFPDRGTPIDSVARSYELREAGYRNGYLDPDLLVEVPSSVGYCGLEEEAAESWQAMMVHARRDGVYFEAGWCYRTYGQQVSTRARNCPLTDVVSWRDEEVTTKNGGTKVVKVRVVSRKIVCRVPTALPGHSNHGWGRAVDVAVSGDAISCRSQAFYWLVENAHLYGWVHPWWAHCGMPREEAWHWEWGGTKAIRATVSLTTKLD